MSKHSSKCKHTSNRHLCDVLELSAYFLKVGLKLKLRYSIFFPIKWLLELETFSGRTWFCPWGIDWIIGLLSFAIGAI